MWMLPAVIVGGTYVSSSLFFTKYPQFLPQFIKNRKGWQVKKGLFATNVHISHRGGAAEFYENTLGAFQASANLGTQMLELDVHLTQDGQVVVCHDQNLLRVTGENANIKELTYEKLPILKPQVPIDFLYSQTFQSSDAETSDRKIPLLKDVFEKFPDINVNIDIKTYDENLIMEVNQQIKRYKVTYFTIRGICDPILIF